MVILDELKNRLRHQFLKQKNIITIGLDWGFSSIKLVVLEYKENINILKDARIIQLPSKEINLSSLIKDFDLSGGVNLGICGPNVIVRYVTMTKMNQDEFRKSLRFEAVRHLPFPLEEVNLEGVILKDLPDNQILVMLAAAKKDFVNRWLKLFQEAGIKVNVLDIDSLALINAFNYTHMQKNNAPSEAVALLNIGAAITNINILENGIPHFSRDINFSSKDFDKEASKEVAIGNLVAEIRKSFDYFETASAASVNKIFLSGGGSLVSNLVSSLESLLDIKIERWDPFSNFELEPSLDETNIRKSSAQFAVAIGLALR